MKKWIINFACWAVFVVVTSAGVWLCDRLFDIGLGLLPHIETVLIWCKAHPPMLLFVLLAAAATVSTLTPKDRV